MSEKGVEERAREREKEIQQGPIKLGASATLISHNYMPSLPPLHFHANYQEETQIYAASSFLPSLIPSLLPSDPSLLSLSVPAYYLSTALLVSAVAFCKKHFSGGMKCERCDTCGGGERSRADGQLSSSRCDALIRSPSVFDSPPPPHSNHSLGADGVVHMGGWGGVSGRGERRCQPHLFALLAAPMLLLLEELEVELFLLLLVELLELLLQEGDSREASQRVSAGDGGMTFFCFAG